LPKSSASWANRPGRETDHVRADWRWFKALTNDWREAPIIAQDNRQLEAFA
jgi:hypothetical protein